MRYESRFVEKPFNEFVEGRMDTFSDMGFIQGVKKIALENGHDLQNIVPFIAKNDGWFGVYGLYSTPEEVIIAYEKYISVVELKIG